MPRTSNVHIALLRGINVGGRNKLPMAELRAALTKGGYEQVETYIQSGNVVFRSAMAPDALEAHLEQTIEEAFGIDTPVIVRSAERWVGYAQGNPFRAEAEADGGAVLLVFSKQAPHSSAAADLQARATMGERVTLTDDAIWIHYAGGVGRSKLTPVLLDRLVGSSTTARNWRTVLELETMAREAMSE